MSPLTKVSEFDIRRNTSLRQHSQPSPGLRSSAVKVKKSQENIALQGMLRLGTETGDISQFPTHSVGLPKPHSRASCRRTGSSESVFGGHRPWGQQTPLPPPDGLRHHGPRPRPSTPGMSRPGSARSVKTSYRNAQYPQERGQRSHTPVLEAFTKPHALPYGAQTNRSMMAPRGRVDPPSYQQQTHCSHSVRPRVSSFRTCSPAFSDTPAAVYPPMPIYDRSASDGPAPATYLNHQCTPCNCTDMNRSVSSLQRFPSPAMSNGCYSGRRSPFPSRSTTPIPTAFQSSPLGSNHSYESLQHIYRSLNSSMTPVYYDYSEPYMQDTYPGIGTNSSVASLSANADRIIQEDEPALYIRQAQTPFGLLPGSIFSPSELPAISDSLSHSALDKPPNTTRSRASSMTASTKSEVNNITTAKSEDVGSSARAETDPEPQERRDCGALSFQRSTSRRLGIATGPFFSSGARGLKRLSARAHSLPRTDPDSKCFSQPESRTPNSEEIRESGHMAQSNHSYAKKMPKSMSLGHTAVTELPAQPNIGHYSLGPSQPVENRHRCSDEAHRADRMGILCPSPERPLSSQSSQIRFGKILDHEDGETGPTSSTSVPRALTRLRDKGSPARRFRVTPLPEGYTELEGRSSWQDRLAPRASREVTSQSTDHEKSTVESLLDRHIECLGLESSKPGSARDSFPELSGSRKSTLSLDRDVRPTRISDRLDNIRWRGHVRSATEKFESYANMTPEQKALIPVRLFHGSRKRHSNDPKSDTSASQEIKTAQEMDHERQSRSWLTLPSTSRVCSEDPSFVGRQESESNTSHEEAISAAATKDPESRTDLAIIADHPESLRRKSADDKDPCVEQLQHSVHEHESQEQTNVRLRLKMKAQSLPASCSKVLTDQHVWSNKKHAPRMQVAIATQDEKNAADPHNKSVDGILAELPAAEVKDIIRPSPSLRRLQSKPKSNLDMTKKPSMHTLKSQKSGLSQAYQVPYIPADSKYPRLAAPDLGPPLNTMSFDLSLRLNPELSLREQKSFFSEESQVSCLKDNLRKRLHGIGNKLNLSPKVSEDPLLVKEQRKDSASHTPRSKGHRKSDSTQHNGQTVGMSNFAYKKLRWLKKLRAWWKKQKSRLRGKKDLKARRTSRRRSSADNI